MISPAHGMTSPYRRKKDPEKLPSPLLEYYECIEIILP